MFNRMATSLLRSGYRATLAIALVACLGANAKADLIQFNPTGGATTIGGFNPGTFTISSLNFGSGDAVAVGAITSGTGLTVGDTFQLYYQTKLVSVNTPSGGVFLNGLNAANGYQITEVSTFTERVTSLTPTSSGLTATFALAPGPNVTKIYFQDLAASGAVAANAITGQGYNQGTLLLTKTVNQDTSNFTDATRGGGLGTAPLNQSGGGDYSGNTTDQGSGSATVNLGVGGYLSNFFLTPNLIASTFSTNLVLPFKDLAPSNAFNDPNAPVGSAPTIIPNIGGPTGINGVTGTDFLLQVSGATESFTAVPEPASIAMTLLGFAGAGVGSIVARRRKAQA